MHCQFKMIFEIKEIRNYVYMRKDALHWNSEERTSDWQPIKQHLDFNNTFTYWFGSKSIGKVIMPAIWFMNKHFMTINSLTPSLFSAHLSPKASETWGQGFLNTNNLFSETFFLDRFCRKNFVGNFLPNSFQFSWNFLKRIWIESRA